MLLIAATFPEEGAGLLTGQIESSGPALSLAGKSLDCIQGSSALIGAAVQVCRYFGVELPHVALAGDIGRGDGSKLIYSYIENEIRSLKPSILCLHYILPSIAAAVRIVKAVNLCNPKPLLLADAGSMYALKAARVSCQADLLTPDPGEMGFLADPEAVHPAYITRHIFSMDTQDVPALIEQARQNGTLPKLLVVKGATDYIAENGSIIATVTEPDVPALESVGGTGDTLAGLLAGFIHAGMTPVDAALAAARCNRLAGKIGNVTPATRVAEFIQHFPEAIRCYMKEKDEEQKIP